MSRPPPPSDSLPYALYTAAQVRALDQAAIASGMPGGALMARAGEAAYQLLRARWPEARRITLLCGAGNNGGDGYVLARLARADGLDVTLFQLGDVSRLGADAKGMLEAWLGMGGKLEAFQELPRRSDVIVDALLGIGLERPVEDKWARAVRAVNAQRAPVLAIDIPTGLHADTGRVLGTAIRAAATLSFIGLKQGLFTGAGPACCGDIYFDGLAVPAVIYAREILSARRLDWAKVSDRVEPRRRDAHKGDFGHV
ncbi:MAG: NAD(P)H-hydrate epimerase, partial [Chromatiaceae bacterium]